MGDSISSGDVEAKLANAPKRFSTSPRSPAVPDLPRAVRGARARLNDHERRCLAARARSSARRVPALGGGPPPLHFPSAVVAASHLLVSTTLMSSPFSHSFVSSHPPHGAASLKVDRLRESTKPSHNYSLWVRSSDSNKKLSKSFC